MAAHENEGALALDVERVICRLADLPADGARAFTLGAGEWPLRGFLVCSAGKVHAYLNRCPHAGHPLNLLPQRFLTADGSLILCASHGALFEKTTGLCVAGPCFGRHLRSLSLQICANYVLLASEVDLNVFADPPP